MLRARRHPIPDLVQVTLQVLLEPRQRHPIHARSTAVRLHPLVRLPDELLGNVIRLCLRHRLLPSRVGLSLAGVSGPFAPPALPGFIATANPSVPAPRIGTRLLAVPPLGGLPWHRGARFPRSAQEPLAGLTPSSCRSPLGRSAGCLRASSQANNWSPVSATSQRFRHVLNGSLAFVLPAHT